QVAVGYQQSLFKNIDTLVRGARCDDDFDVRPELFERFAVRAEEAGSRLSARCELDLDRFSCLLAGDGHGRASLILGIKEGERVALSRVHAGHLELTVEEQSR